MKNNLPLTPQLDPKRIQELLTYQAFVEALQNPETLPYMKEMTILAMEMLLRTHESDVSH
jgi:hypothetical protein